ncbi:MAG: polysaccharide biosynthesis protein [Anaerocolumna sp.]|jgi:FlaA1/EpsC-like NDP-sugar epimerase|nr:polysaccharide biosynthesis protein [Anaerocolumna sp.]
MSKLRKYPKPSVFIIDSVIIILANVLSVFLFYKSNLNPVDINQILPHIFLPFLCIVICQFFLKTYQNVWKYAEQREYLLLCFGVIAGYMLYFLINYFILEYKTSLIFAVIASYISNLTMLLVRFISHIYNKKIKSISNEKISLAIVGAGSAGVLLMEEIRHKASSNYKIHCFIDDNPEKIGKKIRGIKVYGPINHFEEIVKSLPIKEVILAIPSLSNERKDKILKTFSKTNLKVRVLPDLLSILHDSENNLLASVRDLNMDDLLGRDSVSFDEKEIKHFLDHKVIMVTGGGGSIGSELCRQIAKSNPAKLVIVDNYENNAYDIQQELINEYSEKLNLYVEIASVQDKEKVEEIFKRYKPQIVFHAAAHKHVPFMENCPDEAIKNNVFGTYNTVQAADRFHVEKFVLISTDKAVNPTSIMGASKRMCEMIIQSMKKVSKTDYVAVRFGNVLGSNGSVIPLFIRQIEHGGPVTITDKRAYRYFMTIPEAAQLVLRAGSMASNSEIYVLDMGHPVNILAMAEKLIRLLGYTPYTEIPIKEIGIRPGEKLYEELLMKEEELTKTENHKIYIERQKEDIEQEEIHKKIELLKEALESKDTNIIKEALKQIIPTFREPKI